VIHIAIAVWLHMSIVPVFKPTVSGARTGHEQISDGPRWHHILRTGELEQPDGMMIILKERF
jgi:hypothetical protein